MKVLIIRLSSLGDVVLATPVVELLKKHHPTAEVDFLVKKEYSELLKGNGCLRRVIPFDGRGEHKRARGLLALISELKKEGYTHLIDLHGNLRSRIISALLWNSKICRYDKQAIKRRMLLRGFRPDIRHTVDAYLTALTPLLPEEAGLKPAPSIHISAEEERGAEKLLHKSGFPDGSVLIGLNPSAKWPTKRWTEEGFVNIGKRAVNELESRVLIFGGPDEKGLCERIADAIGHGAFSVAGKTGLKESAALMKRCRVFVTNDSGPMHMATAVGTPVVAIFGSTVKEFGFSPLGKSVVVEKELKCRPCSLHGSERCPEGHFECMKGISADEVFEKVKRMVKP